jgi:pimeloyl-ACP methyl ester carboxylesterase
MRFDFGGQPVFADTGGKPFDPALPCLVFIHGAQHDHFVWQQLAARCAATGHAVLALDLPGHGQSGGAPLSSIEAMADWLLALLEKVGARGTVNLAGHSMGSLVALETASRLPGRIRRLIMLGTAVPMPVAPMLLQAARENEPKAMALINQWSHSRRALLGACGGHGLWLPAINLRIMERQRSGVLHNDLAVCDAYRRGEEAAASLDCPVTLIAGTHDRMTSVKAARRLAARIGERAHLVELAGVGHAIMAEAPAAAFQAIKTALDAG